MEHAVWGHRVISPVSIRDHIEPARMFRYRSARISSAPQSLHMLQRSFSLSACDRVEVHTVLKRIEFTCRGPNRANTYTTNIEEGLVRLLPSLLNYTRVDMLSIESSVIIQAPKSDIFITISGVSLVQLRSEIKSKRVFSSSVSEQSRFSYKVTSEKGLLMLQT